MFRVALKHMLYGRLRNAVAYFLFKQHADVKYNLTDFSDYIQLLDLLLPLSAYSKTSHT